MKKETDLTMGISQPEKVEEFMNNLIHPLYDTAKYVRDIILSIDKTIAKEFFGMHQLFISLVKWNSLFVVLVEICLLISYLYCRYYSLLH